jgi:hypothetical protein
MLLAARTRSRPQNKVRESETIEQGELARQARNFTARQMLAHQRSRIASG